MKNKLTKVLSVFVLAGAVGAGVAGIAACSNTHTHTAENNAQWVSTDDTTHWKECKDGDGGRVDEAEHVYDDKYDAECNTCGHVREAEVAATGITLDKSSVNVGTTSISGGAGTTVLTATVSPANATENSVTWSSDNKAVATVADGVVTAVAEGTATIKATVGSHTATCTITVESSSISIATVDEFNIFRTSSTLAAGTYKLTSDIDLDGVTLEDTTVTIGGGVVFDGQGFTIKNGVYTNAPSKTGLLCYRLTGSGRVTNVKFLGCSVSSSNESPALLIGEANATAGEISKIEINSCSVTTTGNYGGLLFARTESGTYSVTMSEITVKNNSYVSCAQYGGLLVGDTVGTTTLTFKNLAVAGELKGSSGNGSFIAGRCRGGAITVENAVIDATVSNPTNNAIFSGGSNASAKLTLKNILIKGSNSALLAKTAPTATDYQNVYTVSGVTVTGVSGDTGENTITYLTNTLGFDFTNVWTADGEGGKYRLIASSTNVKSATATLSSIKVFTTGATTRFKKGDTFSSDGLVVMGVYSDGVQLVLTKDASDGYTVDSSAYNANTPNHEPGYTITVKGAENQAITTTYTVTVVNETGFEIDDTHMEHAYLIGDTLDTSNVVVYSVWTDGAREKESSSKYSFAATDLLGTGNALENVGANQSVTVTYTSDYGTYEGKTISVSVLGEKVVPVDGKVYVNVSSEVTDSVSGSKVNGVETFKTVAEAIDFLEACNLDNDVVKVVRVGAGTYEAKITTDLANLTLIGEGQDATTKAYKSVLTYSAVESTVDPVSGSAYGLNCATLQVNGKNFKAYGIAIRNDFDYANKNKEESSPQGLALTINGDGAVIQNCLLYGNQDTLYLKSGRAYFKDTEIDGNIDFIFGEATGLAYFDTCTIKAIQKQASGQASNNGYVTAMRATESDKPTYGYIFSGCTFTDDGNVAAGSMSLGRPWGAKATVAYINCSFSAAYSTAAYDGSTKSRWYEMSGNKPQDADFCEYGSTGEGAITTAVTGGSVLTAEEAANYTAANMFGTSNSSNYTTAWDYASALTALSGYVTDMSSASVSATAVYAASETLSITIGSSVELGASVTPWNATDKSVTVAVADTNIATYANGKITGVAVGTTTVTISKEGLTSLTVTVTVAPADTTIRESKSWIFNNTENSSYSGSIAAGDTYYLDNALELKGNTNGTIVVNSDWYKLTGDASMSLKLLKNTSVTIVCYNKTSLAVNGTDVAESEYTGTSSYVYTYTATDDGVLTLTKASSASQLYFKAISVYVISGLTETTTLDFTTETGLAAAETQAFINGTVTYNNGNTRVEVGTVMKIYAPVGSTAAITWYSETDTQYGAAANATIECDSTTGVITITFHKDSAGTTGTSGLYIKQIVVTVPAQSKTYTYTYGGENGSEWSTTATVDISGSTDTTAVYGLLVKSTSNLTLTATGTKIAIEMTGYTTDSSMHSHMLRSNCLMQAVMF